MRDLNFFARPHLDSQRISRFDLHRTSWHGKRFVFRKHVVALGITRHAHRFPTTPASAKCDILRPARFEIVRHRVPPWAVEKLLRALVAIGYVDEGVLDPPC